MSLTATELDLSSTGLRQSGPAGPIIDETSWGYSIHDQTRHPGIHAHLFALSRFFGTFSVFALATVLVTPDYGAHITAFSLKVALLFALGLGSALFTKAGQQGDHPEFHIDTQTNEIRVGRRKLKGQFSLKVRLAFADVQSVYLLRSKQRGRPARLFLRLDEQGSALEVTSGPAGPLELLRARMAQDLARKPLRAPPASAASLRRVAPRRVSG